MKAALADPGLREPLEAPGLDPQLRHAAGDARADQVRLARRTKVIKEAGIAGR